MKRLGKEDMHDASDQSRKSFWHAARGGEGRAGKKSPKAPHQQARERGVPCQKQSEIIQPARGDLLQHCHLAGKKLERVL